MISVHTPKSLALPPNFEPVFPPGMMGVTVIYLTGLNEIGTQSTNSHQRNKASTSS